MSEKNEGFWYSEYEKHLPMPKAFEGEWGRDAFLRNLIELEDLLMSTYQAVVDMYNDGDYGPYKRYQESGSGVVESRGFSVCRICECVNGGRTFVHDGFMWPDGFRHYIEEHNVKPSDDFIEMVNKKDTGGLLGDFYSELSEAEEVDEFEFLSQIDEDDC